MVENGLPEIGTFWRERRTAYRLRVVEVVEHTPRLVFIRTVVNDEGERVKGNTTKFQRKNWTATFEPELRPFQCPWKRADTQGRCLLSLNHELHHVYGRFPFEGGGVEST